MTFPPRLCTVQAWIKRQSNINYPRTTNRPVKVLFLEVCYWSTLLHWIRCDHLAIG
jgi:hypothetical protein